MGLYGSPRLLGWLVDVAAHDPDPEARAQPPDALDAYAFRQPKST